MKNKKRIISIVTILVLLISSISMYCSYFVIDDNLENNEIDVDNTIDSGISYYTHYLDYIIANEMDNKKDDIKPSKYYSTKGDLDSDIAKELPASFESLLDNWTYLTKDVSDLKYYAIDTVDNTVVANGSSNLIQRLDNDTISDDYQWYLEVVFNGQGVASFQRGSNTLGYLSDFNQFKKNAVTSLADQSYFSDGYYDNVTIENPRNLRIVYAIPNELSKKSYLVNNYNSTPYSEMVLPYALTIAVIVALIMLIIPTKELEAMQPYKSLLRIKTGIIGFIYIFVAATWLETMAHIIRSTLNGDLGYILRINGASGAASIFVPILNVLGWMVLYSFIMFFVFYVKYVLVNGFGNCFVEHSLCYWSYHKLKSFIKRLTVFDLKDELNIASLKLAGTSSLILYIVLLIFSFNIGFGAYHGLSWLLITLFIPTAVFGTAVLLVVRKILAKIRGDYVVLLDATKTLSNGNFNDEITDDLGVFNSLKE